MREIKFRGISKETNEWVFGYYIVAAGMPFISVFGVREPILIIPKTLGQYTGIKDKNDKEIYEGDIVSFEDAECDAEGYHDNVFLNRGVVSYDEVSMCYFFSNRQTVDMEDLYIPTDAEIIGNIYENPELLEE